MKMKVNLRSSNQTFRPNFGQVIPMSDGGYERGYAEGYEKGLTERTHEIRTVTYVDGTSEEKEVALL